MCGKKDKQENVADTATGTAERLRPDRFPTWLDLLAMIVIFLAATFVGGLCMSILRHTAPAMEPGLVNVIAYCVQFVIAVAGIYAYWRRMGGAENAFRFNFKWYNSSLVLLGIVLMLAASIVMEPLINLFPEHWFERLNNAVGRGGWAILMTVFLAPVFEEMLFRGLILESVRQKWGASAAIVFSAALFGLVHVPIWPQVVNAFVMGIIMGYIYVLTDSLVSVIIIHAVNNGLAYMLVEITGNQATDTRAMIGNDTIYWIVYAASLAIFIAAMVSMAVIAAGKTHKRTGITTFFTRPDGENETLPECENNNKQ